MNEQAVATEQETAIRAKLKQHGQQHLLAFADVLTKPQRASLFQQIESIDFDAIDGLISEYVKQKPHAHLPAALQPARYYPHEWRGTAGYDGPKFKTIGEDLIRSGKVAAFTVAGGQGTRLGWNGPKGTFPATVVTGKPLFRIFAEQVLATQKRFNAHVPWYIMTSPLNDAETRAFFADNRYFGLRRHDVFIFPQGVIPSIEATTGKLLLAERWEVAVNPDGHGGSIKALKDSGAIEDMKRRGVEQISYFQVDNPLVRAIDPMFIGLHVAAPDSSGEMSSKMVAKTNPEEKVGVFCQCDGRTRVIEYSDLPYELTNARDEHGALRFNAGSIAIHAISVKFVERLTEDGKRFGLPYHRADKKVPYVDPTTGARIEPEKPNAVKLETFVFDAIERAERSIVYETLRSEEFAPIKNAEGVDSPATSAQAQSNRHGAWLESQNVKIPWRKNGETAAKIEISPMTAMEAEHLNGASLPRAIDPGTEIVL